MIGFMKTILGIMLVGGLFGLCSCTMGKKLDTKKSSSSKILEDSVCSFVTIKEPSFLKFSDSFVDLSIFKEMSIVELLENDIPIEPDWRKLELVKKKLQSFLIQDSLSFSKADIISCFGDPVSNSNPQRIRYHIARNENCPCNNCDKETEFDNCVGVLLYFEEDQLIRLQYLH